MKISKIMQIMKQDKCIIMHNERWKEGENPVFGGNQWGGNGAALYNLEGVPEIKSRDEFGMLYDIKESKRVEYYFDLRPMPELFDMADYAEGEEMADRMKTTVGFEDRVLCAVRGENGTILFVNSRYLEPFRGEEGVEYIIRDGEHGKYLCIRQEMELKAVIMPVIIRGKSKNYRILNEIQMIWREMNHQIEEQETQELEKES